MNKERTKELLPFITAFSEGIEIEVCSVVVWEPLCGDPQWDRPIIDYRIKP